ncbi:putative membrane protein [Sphingomonas sp. PP-CE-3G-477]|uniref:DUF4126 domain-containing protein n=1 Tax=Sphingomonas sp. PP-CE-3G-477 TaxID=2135660 RepID=UPI000D361C50|nr:DUF4126 domain-containing protein [Sphingomonas sp. PP-CE-3G-477]PTQ64894.1 putative membrane protein [Sphingomonas sp. PP-CE-3G-477]
MLVPPLVNGLILAFVIGIVAGLRAMLAPAAVAWAASKGALPLQGTWLAFLGYRFTPWIFTLLAATELVTDQLPSTPSRKVPPQFAARLLTGGLSGAAIGYGIGTPLQGIVLGIVGAVVGIYGGAALRARLATAFGNDRPAALIEDAIAILLAVLVVLSI